MISYGNNRYGMLDRGWQRAQQLLGLNGYIGPAPVSLSEYTYSVLRQSAARESRSNPCAVRDAMSRLVLPEATDSNPSTSRQFQEKPIHDRTRRQR